MTKAGGLGWKPDQIRILDRDLGQSGAAMTPREDFKVLVSDVAMGRVGAIFSLEASRLARSNQDWHRLFELDELILGDIAFMVIGDFNAPGILRHQARARADFAGRCDLFGRLVSPEHISAGVGGIGEDAEQSRMGRPAPNKLAVPCTAKARRGKRRPSSLKRWTTPKAVLSRANKSKTVRTAPWTSWSGSSTILSPSKTNPTGNAKRSSPLDALLSLPPWRRARMICNSACANVPFIPNPASPTEGVERRQAAEIPWAPH